MIRVINATENFKNIPVLFYLERPADEDVVNEWPLWLWHLTEAMEAPGWTMHLPGFFAAVN